MADLATTPILVDPDDVAQVGFDALTAYFPGWTPTDGDFTTRLIQAFAGMIAENQSLATQGLAELIEYFGTVLGLPRFAATAATAVSTWTMIDNAGHTIPAGTNVAISAGDGSLTTFVVAANVTVPPGQVATATGGVTLIAADTGAQATALTGTLVPLDQLSFVDHAILAGPTTGGLDEETTTAYLARFQRFAQILAPRPILAPDFALLVQVLFPQVQRCLAIDLYNASTNTTNQPRCVTVVPIGPDGLPVGSLLLGEIDDELQSRREINFEVFVINPTYTSIAITFTAISITGYQPSDVQTRAVAALTTFLTPSTWGLPPNGDQSVWIDQPKVRFQDVVTCLNNVEGIDYYTALTVNGGTSDITLSGHGALPLPGAITGSVSGP